MNREYMNRRLRAQSAMEYLMTYGWAILIIAVVLGALFSIGVFSGTSLLGTACVASPGFYCGGLFYSHTTGNILINLGQNSGTGWTNTMFAYAPQGTATVGGIPSVLFYSPNSLLSGQVISGMMLPATSSASTPVGTSTAGSIWACYVTATGAAISSAAAGTCSTTAGTVYYVQVATLTAKAT
jgi:hypothetical protein